MEGIIHMSLKEAERIAVMENLIAKRIKQKHAAVQLHLSVRQVQRVLEKYKQYGACGIIHKNRGKTGNRTIAQKEKDRAIALVKQYYSDFGPTFALEKLSQNHGVRFGVDTLRKEMVKQNIWKAKKRKLKDIHPYRDRRACVGELIQLDGSPHRWFGDLAPSCTLVAFIDDATSQIMDGMFVEYEGTWTLFEATAHYLKIYGKPASFYVDKHSTFKINRQASIEEDLRDTQSRSQFSRAMDDLGIEVICANSPQAKGRIERLFQTLQDRLVKELRLNSITTRNEATIYFRRVYIPLHNSKFAVLPKEKTNMHRPLLVSNDLERIFTLRSKRIISKDLIVQYRNTKYQLMPDNGYRYTLKNAAIIILEDKFGKITFEYKDKVVPYGIGIHRVHIEKQVPVVTSKEFIEKRVTIPSPDHPWRSQVYF